MTVQLTYDEILAIVRKKVSQPITLAYVADDTIAVETSVKVLFKTLHITINLTVIRIDGEDVVLAYSGGNGMDLVITAVLHFLDNNVKLGDLYSRLPNNQLVIHLASIPQLQSALKLLTLKAITFTDTGKKIGATLK